MTGEGDESTRSFPATLAAASAAGEWLIARADLLGIDADARYALELCCEEIFANLVIHGGARIALLRLTRHGETARLDVTDDGAPFDPSAPELQADRPDSHDTVGGYGLSLVRRFAKSMSYTRDAGLNRLALEFALAPQAGGLAR